MKSKTYEDAAFATKTGGFSTVFSEHDSLHVFLYVIENNPATYRTYDEVARAVESRLLRQRQREVADAFLAQIRNDADIEVYLTEPAVDEQVPETESDEAEEDKAPEEK
jgi:hypothetical protein